MSPFVIFRAILTATGVGMGDVVVTSSSGGGFMIFWVAVRTIVDQPIHLAPRSCMSHARAHKIDTVTPDCFLSLPICYRFYLTYQPMIAAMAALLKAATQRILWTPRREIEELLHGQLSKVRSRTRSKAQNTEYIRCLKKKQNIYGVLK